MLKFFHQGSLYDYRGPRDAEHLMEFARVGCCGYYLILLLYPALSVFVFRAHRARLV
jgi:hypothetical protein